MSRNLLHKSKLDAFKAWLDQAGIEHRPPRGEFQVLQVKTKNGQWQCVFDRLDAQEHYTVAWSLESIVRAYIRERGTKSGGGGNV
ncbi:hypothetical protein [Caldimonas brevitalea]|uniref:Uncharacterized protein n=1 Tax=Caldimonas brevitalea TaxID=413882 RepID=A0A0G3BH26_9BURK|nr:hypothetical protein [Caldimonas brevitalea]AKJ28754.1 hypothetical protein AAW51_2063 [Caldimonas brevitalea]